MQEEKKQSSLPFQVLFVQKAKKKARKTYKTHKVYIHKQHTSKKGRILISLGES